MKKRAASVWNLSIVACACAAAGLPIPAQPVERWYSTGLYPPLQRLLTSASNLMPFALLDVLLVVLPIVLIGAAARDISRSPRRLRTFATWMWRTAVGAAAVYLLFLVAWGFNYRRVPLERKLRYDSHAVTLDAALDAARLATSRLNMLFGDAHAEPPQATPIDPVLATAFARATKELGASGRTVPGRPKRTAGDPSLG